MQDLSNRPSYSSPILAMIGPSIKSQITHYQCLKNGLISFVVVLRFIRIEYL